MAFYIDTSAMVKLVIAEAESRALMAWLPERHPVSSDWSRTELLRTVRRGAPLHVVRAREVLDAVDLIEVTTDMFERAGLLDPTVLRSLDAVHLAAALSLGDDLEGIVTYDERLAEAARLNGVAVFAPA